jgi:protein SCO1
MVGCGGSGSSSSESNSGTATKSPSFAGLTASPLRKAFPLRLTDYRGDRVDIRDLRGKAVLVSFLYTHCPDVCPLITAHFHTALSELGPKAKDLEILTVSVDPRRDTPAAVKRFLREHRMTGRMNWLLGSRPELERTWKAWGVAARVPNKDPELVEHSAQIYGIDASGAIRTLYAADFEPAQIVHDAPLLARG